MKIVEINCETGEEIIREATKAEKDEAKVRKEQFQAEQAEGEAKAAEKQAILDRIGLTADELKTILG
jgi:hypothetical protein